MTIEEEIVAKLTDVSNSIRRCEGLPIRYSLGKVLSESLQMIDGEIDMLKVEKRKQ